MRGCRSWPPRSQLTTAGAPRSTASRVAEVPLPEQRDRAVNPAEIAIAAPSETEDDKLSRSAASPEQRWQDFIAFVGREKKFLSSHLESGTPLTLPPGQFKIGVAERHHLNYLQDSENLAALVSLARRFFSNDTISVAFALIASDSAPKQPQTGTAPGAASREHSEIVNEALRIFGGSVRSVRREDS
jgi:hypothetical protein